MVINLGDILKFRNCFSGSSLKFSIVEITLCFLDSPAMLVSSISQEKNKTNVKIDLKLIKALTKVLNLNGNLEPTTINPELFIKGENLSFEKNVCQTFATIKTSRNLKGKLSNQIINCQINLKIVVIIKRLKKNNSSSYLDKQSAYNPHTNRVLYNDVNF